MITRTRSWRRLHPAVRVVIVLAVLVIVVNVALSLLDSSTRGADDTAPRSSSLSTGRDGLAAYAEPCGRGVGISVAGQQQRLKENHAGVPYGRRATQHR